MLYKLLIVYEYNSILRHDVFSMEFAKLFKKKKLENL